MTLFTGGSGLLGRHLLPLLPSMYAPSHEQFDINNPTFLTFDTIIHAAAYTDVARSNLEEDEMSACYRVNVLGTRNLVKNTVYRKFIYISTEYATDPCNFYALTKLQGEQEVMRHAGHYLIIRTLFKPRPFEHAKAVTDMWTSGDYVDVIAKDLALAIQWYAEDKIPDGVLNVGTGRKTIYELAKQTRPDILPITRKDIDVILPSDTSMDLTIWNKYKEQYA